MSFCYYIVFLDDKTIREPVLYRGKDADSVFIKMISEEACKIYKTYKNTAPIYMTKEDQSSFKNAKTCYLCQNVIEGDDKVKDHDHLTGKYRGAAHSNCNLQCKLHCNLHLQLQLHIAEELGPDGRMCRWCAEGLQFTREEKMASGTKKRSSGPRRRVRKTFLTYLLNF